MEADVNKAGSDGVIPLSIASKNGHADIVRLLLKYGAGVIYKALSNGATPLSIVSPKMGMQT